MNKDYRLTIGFFDHWKTVKLKRMLGFEGIESLLRLWEFAAQFHTKGILTGMDFEEIEIAAKWSGETGLFVNTLLDEKVRFIDLKNGVFSLHDWEEHQGFIFYSKERVKQAKKAISKRYARQQVNTDSNTDSTTDGTTPSPSPIPLPIPLPTPKKDLSLRDDCILLHEYLKEKVGCNWKFETWEKTYTPRMKVYGLNECKRAVDGFCKNEWNLQNIPEKAPDIIFRNNKQVEKFCQAVPIEPPKQEPIYTTDTRLTDEKLLQPIKGKRK